MLFEFILFAILGWCEFAAPQSPPGKMILMIVFVVLMILWIVAGVTGYSLPFPRR